MRISYNPNTHRRCICCPNHGQPPLQRIVIGEQDSPYPTHAVTLECGHLDPSLTEFRELHPEWTWTEAPR